MKSWIKKLITVICCLIPIAFVLAFSFNQKNSTTISCVGSSGVKPFIETLSTDYLKQHKEIDITVEAGGSGEGINQVSKGFCHIGDSSKDPYSVIKDNELWKTNRIKTVTVSWEAICLVYIPPVSGLTDEQLDTMLDVNDNNVSKLYAAFSGYKGTLLNSNPKVGDFLSTAAQSFLNEQQKETLNNSAFVPYARTGGSTTSGTAYSFFNDSKFADPHTGLNQDQIDAFETGTYGSEWEIVQTDEANSRAWDMFQKNNKPGSVVYLSSGFVESNIELIRKYRYGIFSYNGNPYSINNLSNGYNWCRPLNLMFSLNSYIVSQISSFIDYLLNEVSKDQWNTIGGAPLTQPQKDSMGQLTEKSDFELIEQDQRQYCGANYYAGQ